MATTPTLKRMDLGNIIHLHIPACGNSAQNDVLNGPCRLLGIHIDAHIKAPINDVYVKLYDDRAPTVGTTDPDECLLAKAGTAPFIPVNLEDGLPFETGLSVACVQEAGTAGTTAPDQDILVNLFVLEGVS